MSAFRTGIVVPEMKECPDCCVVKPALDYSPSKIRRDGLYTYCKECTCKRAKRAARTGRTTDRPWGRTRDHSDGTRDCACCGLRKSLGDFSPTDRNPSGRERRCKDCLAAKTRKYNRTIKGRFAFARNLARRMEREWSLSIEEYAMLRSQPCAYCGCELSPTGTGLDRLVSDLGYTRDNVVPCCFECNQAKSNVFTYEEMLVIGRAIRKVKRNRIRKAAARLTNSTAKGE